MTLIMEMDTLGFRTNWNNKLCCDCFTTLRLHNPAKYYVGKLFEITCPKLGAFVAQVRKVKMMRASELDDYTAYLDTGYDADTTRGIVRKMYPNYNDPVLSVVLLQRVKGEEKAEMTEATKAEPVVLKLFDN